MSRSILLAFCLLAGTSVVAQTPEFTLQGLITVDKPTKSIRVVLQDPKEKNVEVASVDPVAVMERAGNPALARIALEVRGRLAKVVDGITP